MLLGIYFLRHTIKHWEMFELHWSLVSCGASWMDKDFVYIYHTLIDQVV